MSRAMSKNEQSEREAFLQETRVGILTVADDGRGPLWSDTSRPSLPNARRFQAS
jgi:hypothetical protein